MGTYPEESRSHFYQISAILSTYWICSPQVCYSIVRHSPFQGESPDCQIYGNHVEYFAIIPSTSAVLNDTSACQTPNPPWLLTARIHSARKVRFVRFSWLS